MFKVFNFHKSNIHQHVCHVLVQIILYGLPYHIYFEGQIDIIVVVVVVKHTFYISKFSSDTSC